MSISVTHTSGFFSCCSVRLDRIVEYINRNGKIPTTVISSSQFSWYKPTPPRDVTFDFFRHYDTVSVDISCLINYNHEFQFIDYSTLDFPRITPLIKKYFSPSDEVVSIVQELHTKYNLDPAKTCVLFYRGNDKNTETEICEYAEYLVYVNKVRAECPDVIFLLQSDETGFLQYMMDRIPNSFYFKDEIRHMNKCMSTVDLQNKATNFEFSKRYLAITVIMSMCKYVVCGSGNCSIWIMFYRGNTNGVYQNLNKRWISNATDSRS